MDQQPERGQFTHDARDRFVHDDIGKGHVAIEHVDPVTHERIKKIIHDPPHTTAEQIAALDHHNKKTGLRHAWKEEGIIPKSPPHQHHHVDRVATHTGSYMLEKEPTEEEKKILEEQKRRDLEHQKQHGGGMEGESPLLTGQQLRERIDRLVEQTIDHMPAGPFVGTKQQPHLVHDIKNEHELGHGHRGPGEGDLPKHFHHGPSIGHTTKAEQHLGKSERENKLAMDMADAERSHRAEHKQRQQEHQQQLQQQYEKEEEQVTKYHLTDLAHFKKGEM